MYLNHFLERRKVESNRKKIISSLIVENNMLRDELIHLEMVNAKLETVLKSLQKGRSE